VIISLIVAMDEQGGIGRGGQLPWHLSADLKRFKALTMGHHLIMGRITCESIGRALPGRTSIIVTRAVDYQFPGCLVVGSLEEALELAESRGESEVFITGGGQIYRLALSLANRIYLTRVHIVAGCDVFFPEFDGDCWKDVEPVIQAMDRKNSYPFTFHVLERTRS
jgi:dihydrofolate reductase